MKKNKIKKFNPYRRLGKVPAIIFTVFFAAVGATIIYFSFAATANTMQIDTGTCSSTNEQLNSSPTATYSIAPWILLTATGPGATYNITTTPAGGTPSTSTYTANSSGNICIQVTDLNLALNAGYIGTFQVSGEETSTNPVTQLTPVTFSYNTTGVFSIDSGLCGTDETLGNSQPITNSSTPTLMTYGDGGAPSYQLYIDGTSIGTFGLGGQHGLVCAKDPITLADGTHTLTGTALAPAAVAGINIPPFTFTVNTSVPPAPTGLTLDTATDTGTKGDDITSISNPEIDGTAPIGSEIFFYTSAGKLIGGGSTPGASGKFQGTTTALPQGVSTFYAEDMNDAGTLSAPSAPLTLTIVNTPPVTAITNPSGGGTVAGTVRLLSSTTTTDNIGIASVQYLVDGKVIGTSTTLSSSYSYVWDSTTISNGTHTLTDVVTDVAGNIGTSPGISFTVNNPTESIVTSITSPSSNAVVHGVVPITISATDPSGISSIKLWFNGTETTVGFNQSSLGHYNWDTTYNNYLDYPNGIYQLYAIAYNNNGGQAQTATINLVVDNGDFNGDGMVDIKDYSIWAYNSGRTGATYAQGDLNGDGQVDINDIVGLEQLFGESDNLPYGQ